MAGMRSPGSIPFDPSGLPLAVRVWCGHAQAGAFDLRLFRPTRGVPVAGWRHHGVLRAPADDTFALPQPPAVNLRHVLRCRFRIGVLPPDEEYSAFLSVLQGDRVAGEVTARGIAESPTVSVLLLARLVSIAEPPAVRNGAGSDEGGS